jgi:peroxiredoxin
MTQGLVLSSVLLWILVLCNLLLTLALIRRTNASSLPREGLKEGQPAPDFTTETLNGQKVTLATYAQHAVVFVFVEPTCEPCREALPGYEALGPKAVQSGVDFILVSMANAEQTRRFVNEFNIQLPILVAPRESNSFMQDYKLSTAPSYCFIDRQGKIQATGFTNLKAGKWKALADTWEANTTRNAALPAYEKEVSH